MNSIYMDNTTEAVHQLISTGERAAAPLQTRTRYWVVVFAITLAIIQYIDRVCISQAASDMRRDLTLTKEQMGYVFGAFTLAYALFEIPGGWLGDRYGSRKVLLRIVCWWSCFTAATGWAGGFASLIAVRFLFGAGEAGCFPNITRAFMTWLLPDERIRAQSILWLAARWGGAVTPLLVVLVLKVVSWRNAFAMFGALGVVWAVLFYRWFRDDPAKHPKVGAAERALLQQNRGFVSGHGNVPWRLFFTSQSAWLIWAQYFCLSFVWYFYVTWLPTYLKDTYGESLGDVPRALLAGVPLFCGGFGSLCSGFLTKRISGLTGSLRQTRRVLGAGGCACSALALLVCAHVKNPIAVMAAMGAASFFGDVTMPCAWGACMDMGGRFAGTFSGSMNMMGNLGGFVGPILVGYVLTMTGQDWTPTFYMSAGACVLGAICWVLVDPTTTLDAQAPAVATAWHI